jgi:hypothetical protein
VTASVDGASAIANSKLGLDVKTMAARSKGELTNDQGIDAKVHDFSYY